MKLKISILLKIITQELYHTVPNSYLEARILLSYFSGKTQEFLLSHPDNMITITEQLFNLVNRRKKYEPIAYITGVKEFYGRDFIVNKNVLIPRPDSETMIDAVKKYYQDGKNIKLLELGSGSGCLIITLLKEIPNLSGTACDISMYALDVAQKNAELHHVADRINFVHSNWFSNIQSKFDIIISNPPYILHNEIDMLANETREYEPKISLFDDNFTAYKIIAQSASQYLNIGGKLFLEIGYKKEKYVSQIFKNKGFKVKQIYHDLIQIARIIELE